MGAGCGPPPSPKMETTMRHLQRPGAKCLLAASLAVTGLIGCDQATTSPVEADPGSAATATDEPNAIEPADEDSTDTAAPSSGTASASVSASAPDTFLVGYDTVTRSDDRLVRRGAGGELGQGQTFGVDDPVRLAGVTVKVIPDGDHDDVPLSFTLYRF